MTTRRKRPAKSRLMALAAYLHQRRGCFVSREEILADVFGHDPESQSRTVDTHIQRLLTLGDGREEILTVRSRLRFGYILAPRPGAEIGAAHA